MSQQADEPIKAELLRIEHDIFAAIKDQDTKKLDQILTDDFVYRNPVEGERQRAEFLAAIDSLSLKILSIWSEDLKVNVYADVAVLTGTQKARIHTEDNTELIGVTAFVDIFVKRQGEWKLALAQGVSLPGET